MAQLQSTNVAGTLCVNGVAIGGGKDFKYACFTGSDTWTPSSDLVDGDGAVDAILVAGGGGGGGWCVCNDSCANLDLSGMPGAGGGGEVLNNWTPITSTGGCTITIGAGGAEASNGGNTSGVGYTVYGGGAGRNYKLSLTRQCVFNCTGITEATAGGPPGGADGRSGGSTVFSAITQVDGWVMTSASFSDNFPQAAPKPLQTICEGDSGSIAQGWGPEQYGIGGNVVISCPAIKCPQTAVCGAGGNAGGGIPDYSACCLNALNGRRISNKPGDPGQPGIVVLKWYE